MYAIGNDSTPQGTFKRRSFIKIQRSAVIHENNKDSSSANSGDTNNNTLLMIKNSENNATPSSNRVSEEETDEAYEDIYDEEEESFKEKINSKKVQNQDDKTETSTLPSKFSETESTNSQATVIYRSEVKRQNTASNDESINTCTNIVPNGKVPQASTGVCNGKKKEVSQFRNILI